MKKLEDLPKRVDFKVPEGYFEELPMRIQSRIATNPEKQGMPAIRVALRYAMPLVAILAIGVVWYMESRPVTIQEKLAQFNEAELTLFVDDAELTSEELAELVTWSAADLDELEDEVYSVLDPSGEGLEISIDELDIENL